jgi:hypothetical protein
MNDRQDAGHILGGNVPLHFDVNVRQDIRIEPGGFRLLAVRAWIEVFRRWQRRTSGDADSVPVLLRAAERSRLLHRYCAIAVLVEPCEEARYWHFVASQLSVTVNVPLPKALLG